MWYGKALQKVLEFTDKLIGYWGVNPPYKTLSFAKDFHFALMALALLRGRAASPCVLLISSSLSMTLSMS